MSEKTPDVLWHDIDKEPLPCRIGGCTYLVCGVERLPMGIQIKHVSVMKNGCERSTTQNRKLVKVYDHALGTYFNAIT